jgi:signal transduction histidine kinase
VRRTSIERRLIGIVLLSQLALAAGLTWAGVSFSHRQSQAAFDSLLHEHAISIAALVRLPEAPGSGLLFERNLTPPAINPHHPDIYEVRLTDGRLIAKSVNWSSDVTESPHKQYWNFQIANRPYRAVRLVNAPILDREGNQPAPAETLTVIYAADSRKMHDEVAAAGLYIGVASLVLLGITLALTVWQIRRRLLPLRALTAEASSINPNHWNFCVPAAAAETAELAPLAQAISAMIEGLQLAFTQQREFLGNAAHELKSPVAILKSTMQSLLQRDRSPAEYRARIEESLDDVERLEKLLQSMLRLARAEQWAAGGVHRELQLVDIAATCAAAVERLRGLIQERKTKVELRADGSIPMCADAEDLELIWVNLLENAIRYSPAGSTVRIGAVTSDGHAVVRVEDQGCGIAEKDLAHIFERFHRGDSSRARETGGFGLGLAIAKALTEAYGGDISATSRLGEGTCIQVELPLS